MAQWIGALRVAVLVAMVAGVSAIFGQASPKATLPKLPQLSKWDPVSGIKALSKSANKQGGRAPAGSFAPPKMPSFKLPTPKMPSFAAAASAGNKKQQLDPRRLARPAVPKLPKLPNLDPFRGMNFKALSKSANKQGGKAPASSFPMPPKMPSFKPPTPKMPSFAAAAPFGNKKQQLDPRRLAHPAVPARKHLVGPFGMKIPLPSLPQGQQPARRAAATKISAPFKGFQVGWPQIPKSKIPKISLPKMPRFGFGKKPRFEM